MKKYHLYVFSQKLGTWAAEVLCNDETMVCYGEINTEDDAYLVGEAFIDGIKMIEGE